MNLLATLWNDVRHAARTLARTPVFTITVVVTLALCIGANSAVFSALDAVLLKPLPFPSGDRLMRLTQARADGQESLVAPVRLEDWNRLNSTFEALTSYYVEDVSDTTGELPESTRRATVAPRFFEVWGIAPALGRGFALDDHRGVPSIVVISDRYWVNRLGADPNVLDREVIIGGTARRIVGVMPRTFLFPDRGTDLWVPAAIDAPFAQSRELAWYPGIGRLKPGVAPAAARADLDVIQAQLGSDYPETDADLRVRIEPLKDGIVSGIRGSLWLLFGAASVLLLIACTNIATLLLARATERRQQISLKLSLGASRLRLIAEALTETAVLGVAGTACGMVLATSAAQLLSSLGGAPRMDEIAVDQRVLIYTLAAVAVVTVVCGSFPALRSAREGLAGVLAGAGRAQVSARQSLHWLLVGVQVALSVALLTGAGLLLRSLQELSQADAGFEPNRLLTFRVSGSFADTANWEAFQQRFLVTLDALRALPGVEGVATAGSLPGVPTAYENEYEMLGADTSTHVLAEERAVSPSYFATLGIPLAEGQSCRSGLAGNGEVLVNRRFVDSYLAGGSVIGSRIVRRQPIPGDATVVGVVGDARERGLDREPVPTVYFCSNASSPTPFFLVRTRGDPAAVASAVRLKMKELEPLRAVYDISSLDEQIGDAYAENRLRAVLLGLFAATALSLAGLGLYGTLSYVISLSRREVGLRIALGALRGQIVSKFLLKTVRVVALACVAGLLLAFALSRALSGMLFGISATDPLTVLAVLVIVATVGGAATLIPAVRASRIEPMQALREE